MYFLVLSTLTAHRHLHIIWHVFVACVIIIIIFTEIEKHIHYTQNATATHNNKKREFI
jgi:hypothetical protein